MEPPKLCKVVAKPKQMFLKPRSRCPLPAGSNPPVRQFASPHMSSRVTLDLLIDNRDNNCHLICPEYRAQVLYGNDMLALHQPLFGQCQQRSSRSRVLSLSPCCERHALFSGGVFRDQDLSYANANLVVDRISIDEPISKSAPQNIFQSQLVLFVFGALFC